jgi:hypothetical protein
VVAFRIP